MILVDTSVWIDHLHRADSRMTEMLGRDEVGSHDLVIEELALGSLKNRDGLLAALGNLRRFPVASHAEATDLVERHRLWGRGLSAVDSRLLAAALIEPGALLWTRDKRLHSAAGDVGAALVGWR